MYNCNKFPKNKEIYTSDFKYFIFFNLNNGLSSKIEPPSVYNKIVSISRNRHRALPLNINYKSSHRISTLKYDQLYTQTQRLAVDFELFARSARFLSFIFNRNILSIITSQTDTGYRPTTISSSVLCCILHILCVFCSTPARAPNAHTFQ